MAMASLMLSDAVIDTGVNLPGNIAVIQAHPSFDGNGCDEDDDSPQREIQCFRFKEFRNRCFTELIPDDENQDGNGKGCQVFKPPVTKGVVFVRRTIAQLGAYYRNKRRSHIAQVVEGIGNDGDAATGHADEKLPDEQEEIADNTQDAADDAVLLADLFVSCIAVILYSMTDDIFNHTYRLFGILKIGIIVA